MVGDELRREERLSARTKVCVDRFGAYNDLSEGFLGYFFPLAPTRLESHMSLGRAGPTRPTHADQLG
jgi:hypothetical protein